MNYLLGYRHPSITLYKPKINRKRQIGIIGFILSAIAADGIIPGTFGQITRKALSIIKSNQFFIYQ